MPRRTNDLSHSSEYIPVGQEGESSWKGMDKADQRTDDSSNNFATTCFSGNGDKGEVVYWKYLEVFIAELVGTGLLMCVGCMSTVGGMLGGPFPVLQPAFTFGMVVSSIIQIFGHISAAHLNPAVTACFFMQGSISVCMALNYLAAEVIGAVAGLTFLKLMTPSDVLGDGCLCCTVPHSSLNFAQAAAVEFVATAFLVLVVCSVTDPANAAKQDSVPLKFGLLIIALSIAAGPYTGASMNPARSFAPALLSGNWQHHWIYWASPLAAGFLVPALYKLCFRRR